MERIVEIPARPPRHDEWVTLLHQLTEQIENGTVYDRDLQAIGEASVAVNNALAQRLTGRRT